MSEMTPDNFFEGFVEPNYSDWQNDTGSVRLAFNTAVPAFHLADHYCRYFQKKDAEFLKRHGNDEDGLKHVQAELIRREPSFKIIQDMANAYKHLYPRQSCSIASGGAVFCVEYEGEKIEIGDEDINFEVVIHHKDGRTTKFSEAIENVIDMWAEIIGSENQPAI